jgi:acylphosphatase
MPAMNECRRFRVEGRVQGVWFRESTRQQAKRLGITGYARNCPDGSVEVLACGPADAVNALRDWLREGPQLARVVALQEFAEDGPCAGDFTTA